MPPIPLLRVAKGNDLSFAIRIAPAAHPTTGVLTPYPGTSIDGYIATPAAPDTPLNGTTLTFPAITAGFFVWFFDAAAVTACLNSIAPADGAPLLLRFVGAGELSAARAAYYEAARLVP